MFSKTKKALDTAKEAIMDTGQQKEKKTYVFEFIGTIFIHQSKTEYEAYEQGAEKGISSYKYKLIETIGNTKFYESTPETYSNGYPFVALVEAEDFDAVIGFKSFHQLETYIQKWGIIGCFAKHFLPVNIPRPEAAKPNITYSSVVPRPAVRW